MSINRVMVSGNLTRDPELRQTAGGMSVLSFGIAVNDRRKNSQTGEWEDYPNFLDCTLFGTRAEGLSKILVKGFRVAIDGKLRWSQWEKDGQKRSKVEIIVDSLDFMSSRNGSAAATQAPAVAPAVPSEPAMQEAPIASAPTYAEASTPVSAESMPSAPAPESVAEVSAEPYGDDIPF